MLFGCEVYRSLMILERPTVDQPVLPVRTHDENNFVANRPIIDRIAGAVVGSLGVVVRVAHATETPFFCPMHHCHQEWVLHLVKVGSSKTSLDGEAMKLCSDLENDRLT